MKKNKQMNHITCETLNAVFVSWLVGQMWVCPSWKCLTAGQGQTPFHTFVKLTWFSCNTVLIWYCLNRPAWIKAVMKTRRYSAAYWSLSLLVKMFFMIHHFELVPVWILQCVTHTLCSQRFDELSLPACEWECMFLWNHNQSCIKNIRVKI